MPSVEEALAAKTQLGGDLAAGVNTLSLNQQVTFTQYTKVVLPLDGFVFWVKSDLLSESALYNAAQFNNAMLDAGPNLITPAPTLTVMGSLHYETIRQQDEDQTLGVNRVVFTSLSNVTDLNLVGPNTMYVAEVGPEKVRYAFSRRDMFYAQADLYHYVGTALYPALASQIIDDVSQFDSRELIVSNSLPIWLGLNSFVPLPGQLSSTVQLYPSFAVPDNIEPPYGTVHIAPEGTVALQGAPYLDENLSHWQLAQDRVRITLYGLRNTDALNFMDMVNFYSVNSDNLGMMNMPIVKDEKRTQVEFAILAMKKTLDYEVSYYQNTVRAIARQLITSAVPSYIIKAA